MIQRLRAILACESGATAIEYGFIAMLISLTIIAGLNVIGGSVSTFYMDAASGITR